MKLGFIGTGVISDAIIRGLVTTDYDVTEILVSERGKEFSQALVSDYKIITVCEENQDIIDRSDLLFLAVRPQIAQDVFKDLSFERDVPIISLIATISIATLRDWTGSKAHMDRAIPLPSVMYHNCVSAIYPGSKTAVELFDKLGGTVVAPTIAAFDAYANGSALMASYFGFLHKSAEWMAGQGTDYHDARKYLGALFSSLGNTAQQKTDQSFDQLREGHATPGGLNEQMFDVFAKAGGLDALQTALDDVYARIRKAGGNT